MPYHWHALITLTGDEPLGRVVAGMKGKTVMALASERRHLIWKRAFHDHALRRDQDVLTVYRYIINNPVRAGLVQVPSAWPWRGGLLLDAVEADIPFANGSTV